MIYGSVCSGIEAASVAWHPLGWQASFLSEIEPFPRAVLAHHYPDTPLHGDFTTIQKDQYAAIDLLVGGTPCQSFSVAGLRQGLNDPRGNLMLEFGSLARRLGPTWLVWENVPGVLSANRGRDFGTFLGMLAELGYGFAYRVLDAQYFGVAQRRRRVFVVGYLGDWRPAAAVLFERESVSRNPAPSREKRQETAGRPSVCAASSDVYPTLDASVDRKWGSNQWVNNGFAIMSSGQANAEVRTDGGAPALTCLHEAPIVSYGIQSTIIGRKPENGPQGTGICEDLSFTLTKTDQHGVAYSIRTANTSSNGWGLQQEVTHTLDTAQGVAVAQPKAFAQNTRDEVRYVNGDGSLVGALAAEPGMKQTSYIQQSMAVRRLTPVECERLQGFPDTYTAIPWRNKPVADCPDGPRYKALGNSMAVPVMAWIGRRIDAVSAVLRGE